MTRDDFMQYLRDSGFNVRNRSERAILAVCIPPDDSESLWAEVWVFGADEKEIRLALPTPWMYGAPGKPGMLRQFLVRCRSWRQAAGITFELLRRFRHYSRSSKRVDFCNVVVGTIPAARLICDEGSIRYRQSAKPGVDILPSEQVHEVIPVPAWLLPEIV